jgi:hypothetical protein
MASVLADRDQVDRDALAMRTRAARRVTVHLRRAVAAFVAAALAQAAMARLSADGKLTPAQQQRARAALNTAAAALSVDVAGQTTAAVAAAIALALKHEAPLLREFGIDSKTIMVKLTDPVLSLAGQSSQRVLASAIADVERALGGSLETAADLEGVAAKAGGVVSRVERNVDFLASRALNEATRQIAASATTLAPPKPLTGPGASGEPPMSSNGRTPLVKTGLRVVWVAERDACLVCLALSGSVIDPNSGAAFDEEATFGKFGSAMEVWPRGMPLMSPPRHPNCHCRLRIIAASNVAVPAALRREAERSVARGWSGSDSKIQRLNAADRLLKHGSTLGKSVQHRSRTDIARGKFSDRHHPRVPELRAG